MKTTPQLFKFNISKTDLYSLYSPDLDKIFDSYDCSWLFSNPKIITDTIKRYNEKQRFQHNQKHLNELCYLINFLKDKKIINDFGASKLFLISVFHDSIYDPREFNNEEKSANLFLNFVIEEIYLTKKSYFSSYSNNIKKIDFIKNNHEKGLDIIEIYEAILDTKTHKPTNQTSEIFSTMDLFPLSNYTFQELLEVEENIFKEYQCYDYLFYHKNRLKILTEFNNILQNPELESLINYIKYKKVRIALYPGSFNPIHIGHVDIIEKAEKVFDKVVICRGINPKKTNNVYTDLFNFEPFREVKKMYGYQFEFLKELNDTVRKYEKENNLPEIVEYTFIRGLRNHTDFDFEFNQLQYSKRFSEENNLDFNVVYFFSESNLSHVSSSDIRAMMNDATGDKLSKNFLPKQSNE